MSADTAPPTKTELRRWLKRMRSEIQFAEHAIKKGDGRELDLTMDEINGCAAELKRLAETFGS
jgi:hypothetical protein